MDKKKRIVAGLFTAVMIIGVFASCNGGSKKTSSGKKPQIVYGEKTVAEMLPDFTEEVQEHKAENTDTVGWLEVPYTTINDVVVQGDDNQYYLRRNFKKETQFNGIFYADFRSQIGSGTKEDLPINLTIYGHALTDDPANKNYDEKFGPLHDLRNPEKASEIPYIFFSTDQGTYAYEIIAVFLANADNPDNPYNKGDAVKGEFHDIVRNEILPRSMYDYGVEISDDDKFITLSTCIYVLEDGTATNYPNTYYRYAVMGRLVDPESKEKENLGLTLNEKRLIDPDGKWDQAA